MVRWGHLTLRCICVINLSSTTKMRVKIFEIYSLLIPWDADPGAIVDLMRIHPRILLFKMHCFGKVLISARHHIGLLGILYSIVCFGDFQAHLRHWGVLSSSWWFVKLFIFMIYYLHFVGSDGACTHSRALIVAWEIVAPSGLLLRIHWVPLLNGKLLPRIIWEQR